MSSPGPGAAYLMRLIAEKKELDERLEKLLYYLDTHQSILQPRNQLRLFKVQANVMEQYSMILNARLVDLGAITQVQHQYEAGQ